jgi:hypothetical protein
MNPARRFFGVWLPVVGIMGQLLFAADPASSKSQLHIPIGVPDAPDTLKTFVEPDGSFSPGFGSFGVSFRLPEEPNANAAMSAKTSSGAAASHGLRSGGLLIPWCRIPGGGAIIGKVEICAVKRPGFLADSHIVAARVRLENTTDQVAATSLSVNITPEGPAGGPLHALSFSQQAFFTEDRAILVADTPSRGAILGESAFAPRALAPSQDTHVVSAKGDCRGEMIFDITIQAKQSTTLGFICPVLPGRRAVGHVWDGKSPWAQLDLADPISGEGGLLQPELGLSFCRDMRVDDLFEECEKEWRKLVGSVRIELPDPRWAECFAAITSHAALAMNDGAPDVAVINYNVFNRDGIYVANMLQKAGAFDLAARAIDYFLTHPFNGRVEPEADNPGQVLWIMGEHWKFTRDRTWLARVYPAAQKIAAMIEYYRTTPEPHWVNAASLDFGEALPPEKRQRLRPGACDGTHPEYTEAFDLAGMRTAVVLADAAGQKTYAAKWSALAEKLAVAYDERFGADLRKGEYGNYSVLWPCRLYPLEGEKARKQFGQIGAQKPTSWRYFPLARAHQGLLAGNRAAAAETLAIHLDHEQMRGWYAFDEGGPSGPGNWGKVRTNWEVKRNPDGSVKSAMAMPHGWAIAEMQLLLRDALAFEDGDKLVLFAGVPADWFGKPMKIENLPTHFGKVSVAWQPQTERVGELMLSGNGVPSGGYVVRTPKGDVLISTETKATKIEF